MIRTLCTLHQGQCHGRPVLRGELSRDVVTVDRDGNERRYPRGTPLLLRRNKSGSYQLLATLEDGEPSEAEIQAGLEAFERERQQVLSGRGEYVSPF